MQITSTVLCCDFVMLKGWYICSILIPPIVYAGVIVGHVSSPLKEKFIHETRQHQIATASNGVYEPQYP